MKGGEGERGKGREVEREKEIEKATLAGEPHAVREGRRGMSEGRIRKNPTLAGGPFRNGAQARDKENLLFERRRSEFTTSVGFASCQIFPRAGA